MRPIIRGANPRAGGTRSRPAQRPQQRLLDPIVGSTIPDDAYGTWRGYLVRDFGKYCAYCEIPMGSAIQVEHKDPKSASANPNAAVEWTNLVLACGACNSQKGTRPGALEAMDEFAWPDVDIRFSTDPAQSSVVYFLQRDIPVWLDMVDEYNDNTNQDQDHSENAVLVRAGGIETDKAWNTIDMVNLNGIFRDATYNDVTGVWDGGRLQYLSSASDRRVQLRTKTWRFALSATERLHAVNTTHPASRNLMERQIISTAVSCGFWSVWMTVFSNEVNAGRLALAAGDTLPTLLQRLFVTGVPALDIRFPGTDVARVNPFNQI